MRFISTTLFLMLISYSLFGQRLDSAQLDLGKLRIHISPDGSWGNDQQAFLEYRKEDGSYVSLLKKGGLHYGGILPGGDLVVGNYDGTSNVAGRPDTNASLTGVWKVTKAEILAHLADYEDNGVIDNPQAAIYSWPARFNSFFTEYTGDILPVTFGGSLADFWDSDSDGIYDPSNGDTPYFITRTNGQLCSPQEVPTEMYWMSFYQGASSQSPTPLQANFTMVIVSYACNDFAETDLENRSFVVHAKSIYNSSETNSSAIFGYNMIASIGDPENDAIGSDTINNLTYFYPNEPQDT